MMTTLPVHMGTEDNTTGSNLDNSDMVRENAYRSDNANNAA